MNQLSASFDPIKAFFAKHHAVIFISVLGLLLAGAIYALYDVVAAATAPIDDATSTITEFDQKTIDKIKNLHASGDASGSVALPSPRANPFVE